MVQKRMLKTLKPIDFQCGDMAHIDKGFNISLFTRLVENTQDFITSNEHWCCLVLHIYLLNIISLRCHFIKLNL